MQQLWPLIAQRMGPTPDVAKLKQCYLSWIGRGFNPRAVTWLDWYRDGIPARPNASGGFKVAQESTPSPIMRPKNWRELGLKPGDQNYKWHPEDYAQ